jgi:uncharacterized membrane-anchored protein
MTDEATEESAEHTATAKQPEKQPENIQQSAKPLETVAYKKRKACLVAVVGLQVAIMCGTAIAPALTLSTGKTVTLQTKPVDPYDMFRGDYVHLRYDINDVIVTPPATNGADIYVALHKLGPYWSARTAAASKPTLMPGELCIKGKYFRDYAQVHYGIEQVFVPEKTGRSAERAKSLSVDVAVDDAGNSVIKRVMNGDQTMYDSSKLIFGG